MQTFFLWIAGGMFVLWVFAIQLVPRKARLFLARHPIILALFHIPVMIFFSSIGGEGMIFASASLIGGLAGQSYLSFWGMRHGLTFFGKKTANYKPIPKKRRVSFLTKVDLFFTNRLLGE